MFRLNMRSDPRAPIASNSALTVALVGVNLFFNIVANASFKYSADSPTWRGLLAWQVIGNVAGLITVITLTALLRYLPLHVAFPVTTGLMVVGVQVAAAAWLFRESISPGRWLGTLLVVAGIVLITGR